jgi:hypothetical protein
MKTVKKIQKRLFLLVDGKKFTAKKGIIYIYFFVISNVTDKRIYKGCWCHVGEVLADSLDWLGI